MYGDIATCRLGIGAVTSPNRRIAWASSGTIRANASGRPSLATLVR